MALSRPNFHGEGRRLAGAKAEPFSRAVEAHLPGRSVHQVRDRGTWVRRIVQVDLDGDESVVFKMERPLQGDGWLPRAEGESHERDVAQLLMPHGLGHVVPQVLVVDDSRQILDQPFIIQAHVGGTRLVDLLYRASREEALAIWESVGALYQRIHALTNDRPGLWQGSTPASPWGDPPDHMYQAEIVEGSGRQALDEGRIRRRTYDRLVALWAAHLPEMQAYQPTLIHYSAFQWNVYLSGAGADWQVTKLTSVGDMLWWEPACDIACLRYPPFGEMTPAWWEAFEVGYGALPPRGRVLLHALRHRLCATMGAYWEPQTERNQAWKKHALDDLDAFMDAVEREAEH